MAGRAIMLGVVVFVGFVLALSHASVIAGANHFGQIGLGRIGNQRPFANFALNSSYTLVATGPYHTVAAIPNTTTLFLFGYNGHGELGNGNFANANTPMALSFPSGITQVAVGGGHTLVLTQSNSLYAFGRNTFGQLCVGSTGEGINSPQLVTMPTGVIPSRIATGWAHTLIVSADGDLYGCGDNSIGQLGLGTSVSFATTPTRNAFYNKNVASVACGAKHSLVRRSVSVPNSLDSFGDNQHGQLCLGTRVSSTTITPDFVNRFVPTTIPLNTFQSNGVINGFAGGLAHTILHVSSRAWACGQNFQGQLGTSSSGSAQSDMQDTSAIGGTGRITYVTGETVVQVAAGWSHSMVRTSVGNVYLFGSNTKGQLGTGSTTPNSFVAVKPTLTFTPVSVVAGGDVSIIVG